MLIDDNYILQNCLRKDGYPNSHLIYRDKEILKYLRNRYDDIPNDLFKIGEVIYRLKFNIENRPVCKICGKPVKFLGEKKGFTDYCSLNCQHKYVSAFNKERWKNMSEEDKQKIQDKIKQTCLKHFGVEYSFQSDNNKRKADKTRELKYGDKNYGKFGSHSFKQKMMQKYGFEHPQSSDIIRSKISKSMLSDNAKNKMIKTCLKKYGVEHVSQLSEVQDKVTESYNKHKTYKTSLEEETLYEILYELYGDNILRCYKTTEYNHNCDFYLKQYNLYIEYQGSFYHNKHLYNKEVDKELYEKIVGKCSKTNKKNNYDNLIRTWTEYDIQKWNDAKNNKLNMLFIYPYFNDNWIFYKTHKDREDIKDNIKNQLYNYIVEHFNNVTNTQLIIGEKR